MVDCKKKKKKKKKVAVVRLQLVYVAVVAQKWHR
jgi:hypothetical protein